MKLKTNVASGVAKTQRLNRKTRSVGNAEHSKCGSVVTTVQLLSVIASNLADGQFVKVTPAEADCVTEGEITGLCFSLYLRGESEKVRLECVSE